MIARVWRGEAIIQNSEAYRRHFVESVHPVLGRVPGHRGALLLQRNRDGDSRTEFMVVTLWDSMQAVRAFAGPDQDRAVVEQAARAVLADFDATVRHYDVVLDTRDPSGGLTGEGQADGCGW
jgi:heme-degrading monooxygenase HmoA